MNKLIFSLFFVLFAQLLWAQNPKNAEKESWSFNNEHNLKSHPWPDRKRPLFNQQQEYKMEWDSNKFHLWSSQADNPFAEMNQYISFTCEPHNKMEICYAPNGDKYKRVGDSLQDDRSSGNNKENEIDLESVIKNGGSPAYQF